MRARCAPTPSKRTSWKRPSYPRSARRSTTAARLKPSTRNTSEATMSDHGVPFSPIAVVGTIALLVAYATAAWSVAAGIAGNTIKSRRLVTSSVYGLYGFAALIGLSAALLIYGFVTHDYAIKYVAETSDTTMSTWY